MTLILSLITKCGAFQVADRQLVWSDGRVHDYDSNKLILFDWRVAFGYTGLAKIDGGNTDEWIARVLERKRADPLPDALKELAATAGKAVKAFQRPLRRLAIAGVGWSRESKDVSRPLFCRVSNFYDQNGAVRPEVDDCFSVEVRFLKKDERFRAFSSGQLVPPRQMKSFNDRTRQLVKGGASENSLLRALVKTIRSVATKNRLVGQSLLSVCIPKTNEVKRTMLVCRPPSGESTTFQYWPANLWDGISRGPIVVAPNVSVSSFESGPREAAKAELGGFVVRNGEPAILFPCCMFYNPLTDTFPAVSVRGDGHTYCPIFTDKDAAEAFKRKESDQLVCMMIWRNDQLLEVLKTIPKLEFICLNPFSSQDGRSFSAPLSALIAALERKAIP